MPQFLQFLLTLRILVCGMTLEDALKVTDIAMYTYVGEHLTDPQHLILRELLKGQEDCREDLAIVLKNLAILHQQTGSIDLARDYCDRALKIAIELGIPLAEECKTLKAQLEDEA